MKNLWILALLILGLTITSCGDDDDGHDHGSGNTPEYHAHIMSPGTDDKNVGDEITITVDFEDHAGGTIHHINVRIYNKADNTQVIYDKPEGTDKHVHTSKSYSYSDTFTLDNVDGHTDWIIEAKVWGEDAGLHEVIETVEFHLHP